MVLNIGENIRKIRECRGLSILDVSVMTGYSESHIAQIERDKRKPSFDCIMDLMSYYQCEPNEIFGVEGGDNCSKGDTNTYEARLRNLSLKDRNRAIKAIDVVLQIFEEVGEDGKK
jgi:transcriptional regulator with XRE-family HTH domain